MFPTTRLRRLRRHPRLRELVRETTLSPSDFVLPLFVKPDGDPTPIGSMPGQSQWPLSRLGEPIEEAAALGVPAVILFGLPEAKDAAGSDALSPGGIIARAIGEAKAAADVLVMTDLCFCEYTDHGHCGVLVERDHGVDVDNDATLPRLGEQAIVHAEAGADVIAPSGMMDGMVAAIRDALDAGGHDGVPILSYAAKYASAFYGPFRDAADSAPQRGDRRSYQMDPANGAEAIREVELDVAEGADMLMVKPALAYLDIIARVKQEWPEIPLAAYNVSGEYAMLKAAAERGWIDHDRVMLESLLAIRRAGADMILTYHATEAARLLGE